VRVLFIASARMASFGVFSRFFPMVGLWSPLALPAAASEVDQVRFVADYARRAWALAEREGRTEWAKILYLEDPSIKIRPIGRYFIASLFEREFGSAPLSGLKQSNCAESKPMPGRALHPP